MFKRTNAITTVFLLAILALFVHAGPALAAGMTISPNSGDYTTTYAATASGFQPGEPVSVWALAPDGSTLGPQNLTADNNGGVQVTGQIPASFPAGKYLVYAKGKYSGVTYSATFTLIAPSQTTTTSTTGTMQPWTGYYYDNMTLSGTPVLSRQDATLDFDWTGTSPGAAVPSENFSAKWDSSQYAATTGNYTISVIADDGVRVWVDGNLVIDAWYDQPPTQYTATVYTTQGWHSMHVEYYQHLGGAMIELQIFPPS